MLFTLWVLGYVAPLMSPIEDSMVSTHVESLSLSPARPAGPFLPVPVGVTADLGERALISLFRGAGELLGPVGDLGTPSLDNLNQRLQQTFSDYFLTSQVYDPFVGNPLSFQEVGSQQALALANSLDFAAVGLVGYSAGGLSALRTARGLSPRTVDLVVQIDSFDPLTGNSPEDEVLPPNVATGINYFQQRNRFNPFRPGFDPFDLQGATNVQGATNLNAEVLFNNRGLTHRNIANYAPLQDRILQDIETYVLQNLAFDRAGALSLLGGTQAVNNILKLAPGANEPGQALISDFIAIDDEVSFQTRFEFRLPPAASAPSGLSLRIQSAATGIGGPSGLSDLILAFDPLPLSAENPTPNTLALLAPGLGPNPLALVAAPFDLDTGEPLTAWINYDGPSDRLRLFLDRSQTQPAVPLADIPLDLAAVVGPLAQVGFQTTVGNSERYGDLLSWDWQTTAASSTSPIDLIWRNPATGQNLLWRQTGDASPSKAELPAVAADWALVGLTDFDQNGSRDLLWRQPATGHVDIWLMQDTALQAILRLTTIPPVWEIQTLADLDQNGSDDLIWRQTQTGENSIWLMDRTMPQRIDPLLPVPPDWQMGGATDVDQDGDPDILWRNSQSGETLFWQMAGLQRQADIPLPEIATDWQVVGLADLDQNGSDDILWRQPTTGQAKVWWMAGASVIGDSGLPSVPADWVLVV